MKTPLRIAFLIVIAALATGWLGLRAQNSALESAQAAAAKGAP
jgi:hypothetical protein